MTKTVALSDMDAIAKLGKFVAASYVALLIMFGIHLLLLMFAGLSPVTYMKKAFPVLSFAFTSRTSAGALPLNIRTQKSMGVPDGIANFAGSFGLSIGQNGWMCGNISSYARGYDCSDSWSGSVNTILFINSRADCCT
jgi:L-cystine uptake protein TcyP (sodium:dicarboxylate symporter family)